MNNSVDWDNWKPTKEAAVCFIQHEEEMLFIEVKNRRGIDGVVEYEDQELFLEPVGGKPEKGESLLDTIVREIEEEINTKVKTIKQVGSEYAHFTNGFSITLHIFFANGLISEPQETDVAKPHLFPITDIPYHKLWRADECFLPFIFEDRKFHSFSVYDGETNKLLWNRVHGLPDDGISINDLPAKHRGILINNLKNMRSSDYSI